MKYIIKNCPACILDPSCCAQWHINNGNAKDCSDITDCVIKRIVNICKAEKDKGFCMTRYGAKVPVSEGWDLACEILQLLEIEECE